MPVHRRRRAGDDVDRRRPHERRHEAVGRPSIEIERRTDLFQHPVAHHGNAGSKRHRLFLVVRHVEHGRAQPPMQQSEFGAGLDAQQRIEVGQRFVEQIDACVARQCPPDRHPLPLPAGQLRRLAVQQSRDVQHRRGARHGRCDGSRCQLAHAQPERQVLPHGHVRIERVALEHHRHVALLRRHTSHIVAADQDAAGAGRVEAGNQTEHRALAAARRTDEHEQFPVRDRQRQVAQHVGARLELLADVLEIDRCHVSLSPRQR